MSRPLRLEIKTPTDAFYEGDVEMVMVKTTDGYEGFMAAHEWALKLLADDGEVRIKEIGNAGSTAKDRDFRIARLKGGVMEVRDHIFIFTEEAEWKKPSKR